LTCERNIIETHFNNVICELDLFFKFNILISVYNKYDMNLMVIKNMKKHFSCIVNKIKEYNPNKDYITNTGHLKKKYYIKIFNSRCSDRNKRYVSHYYDKFYLSREAHLNPGEKLTHYVCDDMDKSIFQCCIIHKKSDYFLNECMLPLDLFACRIHQQISIIENDFKNYLNHIDIGINKYDNFVSFKSLNIPFEAFSGYTFKFLTFIGVIPKNLEAFNKFINKVGLFDIAYDMCHMNIISYMTNSKMINHDDSFTPILDIYHEDINLYLKKSKIISDIYTDEGKLMYYIKLSMIR
jgi:hypothetical protein